MKWLFCLATVAIAMIGAVGCGVDSGDSAGGGGNTGTGGGGPVCLDDPATGDVLEECGIWVSAGLGNDANPGTQAAPVASLKRGIELADELGLNQPDFGPVHLYACGGETWTEPVLLPSGVHLHGGFDCEAGWKYVGAEKRSMVVTSADEVPLTVVYSTYFGGALLTDFHLEAADAVTPGGFSVAMVVSGDVGLEVHRCDFIAGDGADGADGAPGSSDGLPAPDGTPGNNGQDACSAFVTQGGESPETLCGGFPKGGKGGDASPILAENGGDGTPAHPGAPPQAGKGGLGEENASECTNGAQGADGADGVFGAGDKGKPDLTKDGPVGRFGEEGKPATPGQGGGGGGATFGKGAVCGVETPGGAAGGSGGAGGCRGLSGGGGQAGGSSVAVATRSPSNRFFDCNFYSANGGNGGNGGPPQEGGAGGPPGQGGAGAGTIKPGCAGGAGGSGGRGAWGGGGGGGRSVCVAYESSNEPGLTGGSCSTGSGGKGGQGDPAAGSEANGQDAPEGVPLEVWD